MSNIQIQSTGAETVSFKIDGVEMAPALGWPMLIERGQVVVNLPDVTMKVDLEGEVTLDDATVNALHSLGWVKRATGGVVVNNPGATVNLDKACVLPAVKRRDT